MMRRASRERKIYQDKGNMSETKPPSRNNRMICFPSFGILQNPSQHNQNQINAITPRGKLQRISKAWEKDRENNNIRVRGTAKERVPYTVIYERG